MTTTISGDSFLDPLTHCYMGFKYSGLSKTEKTAVEKAAKYNLLVHGFHAGVALLTYATAMAIFAHYAAAVVFGTVGFCLYRQTQSFLDEYGRNPSDILTKLNLPFNVHWVPNRLILGKVREGEERSYTVLVKYYAPDGDLFKGNNRESRRTSWVETIGGRLWPTTIS